MEPTMGPSADSIGRRDQFPNPHRIRGVVSEADEQRP